MEEKPTSKKRKGWPAEDKERVRKVRIQTDSVLLDDDEEGDAEEEKEDVDDENDENDEEEEEEEEESTSGAQFFMEGELEAEEGVD